MVRRAQGNLVGAFWLLAAAAAPAQTVEVRETEPRAFGYALGDLVERRAEVAIPSGWRLDAASLPVPRLGGAVELREARWEAPSWWRPGAPGRLTLRYQLLRSPPAPELLAVALRFEGTRPLSARLDAFTLLVSPLAPEPAPTRRGFGPLRPDAPVPLIDTRRLQARLAAEALAVLLLLGGLAVAWLRSRRRGERPFAEAWRQLRRLPDDAADAAQWREALAALHQALDRSAGEVLFAGGLDAFLARRPAFEPLRPQLARFFELSRRAFFAPGDAAVPEPAWLKGLCRRARALEREAA